MNWKDVAGGIILVSMLPLMLFGTLGIFAWTQSTKYDSRDSLCKSEGHYGYLNDISTMGGKEEFRNYIACYDRNIGKIVVTLYDYEMCGLEPCKLSVVENLRGRLAVP